MKKVIVAIVLALSTTLPLNIQAKNIVVLKEEKLSSKLIIKNISHTYQLIYKDGRWWVYEYDEVYWFGGKWNFQI